MKLSELIIHEPKIERKPKCDIWKKCRYYDKVSTWCNDMGGKGNCAKYEKIKKSLIILMFIFQIGLISATQIIVFPDIQTYTRYENNSEENLTKMIDWTINNSNDKLVLFVGDILDEFGENQTNYIYNMFNKLKENNITYLISWGNHDYEFGGNELNYPTSIQNYSNIHKIENTSMGIVVLPYHFPEQNFSELKNEMDSNYSYILLTHERQENIFYSNNFFINFYGHLDGNNLFINNSKIEVFSGHNDRTYPFNNNIGWLNIVEITNNTINVTTFNPITNENIFIRTLKNESIWNETITEISENVSYLNETTNETYLINQKINLTKRELISWNWNLNYSFGEYYKVNSTNEEKTKEEPKQVVNTGGSSSSGGGSSMKKKKEIIKKTNITNTTNTLPNIINVEKVYPLINELPELKKEQKIEVNKTFFERVLIWIRSIYD